MSDAKLQSVRVSRSERRAGKGVRLASLKAANDNHPTHRGTRTSLVLGRILIVSVALCGIAVLLAWAGWTAMLLWKA